MVIRINDDGEFVVAEDASVFPMYLALQRYSDLQATMAGLYTVGNGEPDPAKHPWPVKPLKRAAGSTKTRPAISGIHMDDGDVWETDEFDADANWNGAKCNAKLTVLNGKITLAGDDDPVVGFLVRAPYWRYANDAVAVEGMMTGANIEVIQFQCGK
jgi:hypothetical protein